MKTPASSPASVTYSLDAHYYTSSQAYAMEQQNLFCRSWQFAGHLSALKNVGDYFVFNIATESCFCIRGKDNQIRAFYNVCQHRAHQLLSGCGNVNTITCPYHSWAYYLDGRFKTAPNIRAVKGFDAADIKLKEIRIDNFCGFIFVNLDNNAAPMDECFPKARQQLQKYVPNIAQLAPLLQIEIPENCNWKVSVENYSECYHCALNHKTFATGIIKANTYNIKPQGQCLRHTTECQNLDKMSYPINLSANKYAGSYSSWFLWPMFSFQVYPGNVLNTYHWQPQGVDKVIVWRGWYSPNAEESSAIRTLAEQDKNTTVAEDIKLVESVQRGLMSRGYKPGPLVIDPNEGVNSEHAISVLQQWMRQAINS